VPLTKDKFFPANFEKETENITIKCHILAEYNKKILNHFFIENS